MLHPKQSWTSRLKRFIKRELRWLQPGLGVKRWLLLTLVGITFIGLGFGVVLLDIYRTASDTWWLPIVSTLSLSFLERPMRALIFGGLGIGFIILGIWGLNRALLLPFIKPGKALVTSVSDYRRRERGPRVVALGGGNGLATLLRGLKKYTRNLTAIVTVADDGGSSGELRRSMGILPPGDIRNCLAALSDDEELITQIFQYRFASGAGLNGHALGNLLITALADITGSFEEAVAESGRVLAVQGQVLPASLHDVRLVADVDMPGIKAPIQIKGESKIPASGGKIRRVWLEPNNPLAYPPTVQAILNAELVVVGPGSLYTSILPNLLVPDLAEALRASRALKFYICNVATQPGETDEFDCGDHLRVLDKHLGPGLFDVIICNSNYHGKLSNGVEWVKIDPDLDQRYQVYCTDLLDADNPWRHDPNKLSQVIMDLFTERTGPLARGEVMQG